MDWLSQPESWVALVTLTVLEIVLGIDNIIFISILVGKLPTAERPKARRLGLGLAMFIRIALLASLAWIAKLTQPLVSPLGHDVSGRDLILLVGGLFLIAKATHEIHDRLEGEEGHGNPRALASFSGILIQILLLDIVFSLDSVITAVGMAQHLAIMVTAVVLAVGVMLFSSAAIGDFVQRHPTIKILALAFLLLIGMSLIAEGFGQHISKGYIYFAMGFSIFVEMLNLRMRKAEEEPLRLREPITPDGEGSES